MSVKSKVSKTKPETSRLTTDHPTELKLDNKNTDKSGDEPETSVLVHQDPTNLSDVDKKYFSGYDRVAIHELMLSDTVRMESYGSAILKNKELFRGKVVLDVGCGTGILSMWAAEAGAKRVIGIDCSDVIYNAEKIIKANKFTDVITLVKGKVEEITLPHDIEEVDIIVSEWMGYCLLFEAFLNSIIFARDKWLRADGLLLPDKCSLHLVGLDEPEYVKWKKNENFWYNVSGFDMSCMDVKPPDSSFTVDVDSAKIATNSCLLQDIDIYKVKLEDLEFDVPFHIQCKKAGTITALCTYFNIEFTHGKRPVAFSTAPEATLTHWKQTLFPFWGTQFTVKHGDNLCGSFNMKVNPLNERSLLIEIDISDDKPANRNKGDITKYKNRYIV